jgi:hypothetical protein
MPTTKKKIDKYTYLNGMVDFKTLLDRKANEIKYMIYVIKVAKLAPSIP